MKTTEITNNQDIIDSRDIVERIKELEGEGVVPLDEIDQEDEVEDAELAEELQHLKALTEEASSSEWSSGVTLISEDYFEDYAREFAEDVGAIDKSYDWPANHIDWERASNELQLDYMGVDFDGVTYYFR
ncbi:hypothetical protein LCGC14_3013290 [marine sediment metagenome]|uniref:Uncharacterized protein n=1 Tax=marine sediment metagenome TaxID=412755 RepID=A0A0F8WXH5_9ZZZZ